MPTKEKLKPVMRPVEILDGTPDKICPRCKGFMQPNRHQECVSCQRKDHRAAAAEQRARDREGERQ